MNPSDRAVGAAVFPEAVRVSARPSGASWLWFPGAQAPGISCGGTVAGRRSGRASPRVPAAAAGAGAGTVNVWSLITCATAWSAVRRRASAGETVAAIALTSVNRLIPVACACLSALMSGAWAAVTAADLARAAALPAAVWPACPFMITITGSSAFCDSVACPSPAGAAASAGTPPDSVRTPPSRAEAVAGTANTDNTLRFAMLSSSGNSGPSSRDACDGNRVATQSD